MASKYLIFLLPALVYARIEIDITASKDDSHREVHFSGANMDVISETERHSFGLNDEALKRAVKSYFGEIPTDVYLRSPTPWGDLYQSYGWRQVTRTLTPQRAKILSITNEPTIVATFVLHNNSSKQADFKADVSQDVVNTVSSSWEKSGDLTVGQDIEYGIDIDVVSISGKTSFEYTSRWGEGTSKSETVKVGSKSGVSVSLEPNQSVQAELYATKGTMKIQIDYEASLSGSLAVNYHQTYKGHHFWSLDVNGVMNAGSFSQRLKSSEIITLGYYTDAHVLIKDNEQAVLYNIPMDMF